MSAPPINRWGFAARPPGVASGPTSVLFRLESSSGQPAEHTGFTLRLVAADHMPDGSRPVWRAAFTLKQVADMQVRRATAPQQREREREREREGGRERADRKAGLAQNPSRSLAKRLSSSLPSLGKL